MLLFCIQFQGLSGLQVHNLCCRRLLRTKRHPKSFEGHIGNGEIDSVHQPYYVSCILLGAGDPTGDNDGHQVILGRSSWAAGSFVHFWALRPYLVTGIGVLHTSQGAYKTFSFLTSSVESHTGLLPKGTLGHPESPLTCSHIPPRTDVCNSCPPGCAKNCTWGCTSCCKFKAALIPTPSAQCQKASPLLFVHVNNKSLQFLEIICTKHIHKICDDGEKFFQFQVLR